MNVKNQVLSEFPIFLFVIAILQNKWTALHFASFNGHCDIVEFLVDNLSVNVNKQANVRKYRFSTENMCACRMAGQR